MLREFFLNSFEKEKIEKKEEREIEKKKKYDIIKELS